MSDHTPSEGPFPLDQPRHPNLEELFEEGQRAILEEAGVLARSHYQVDPGLQAVYQIQSPDPNDRRIKLLEVNEETIASGIVPVGFPAHPPSGLHFPSVVIEITPREYDDLQNRRLTLPDGWEIGERYERPSDTTAPVELRP